MQKQSLNQAWRFHLGDIVNWMLRKEISESEWRVVDLPHDWSIETDRSPENPSGFSNGWFGMGRGFYHKSFTAPEEWRDKQVLVEFEGVYMNAEVWLNENFLGRHPYGYTSFTFDLTPYLQYGEENILRVKVENTGQLNSRWYSGSGIYRPVWLLIGEPVHVAHWGVYVTTPQVSFEEATVRVQTTIENDKETAQNVVLKSVIYGPDNHVCITMESRAEIPAGGQQLVNQEKVVKSPQLWSPETPNLYRLESRVELDGKLMDSETTTFGIRSLAWNAQEGFLLNGKSIKMKGGCVHHDNGVMGAASFPRAEERKVALLKASGFDAIRCAHNPPAPAFLDACDRQGMLVIDETFDCWREGKNPFDYHVYFDDWWQRDTESMVLRDRNHPSVVIWSIGNEVHERDGRSNGAAVARMQADLVRSLDPTRPVTSAINGLKDKTGRGWENTDVVFDALDIGGYNYQWQQYRNDHERHPERMMMGTETFPIEAYDNWMSVLELPYVVGDFVWTSNDYLGESGIGRTYFEGEETGFLGEYPWHQAYCGDIDLAGFKRPQSYYRDILWGSGEPMYIAVHTPIPEGKVEKITRWGWPDVSNSWTWPGREGETFKVDVYSAFPKVELYLNETLIGVKEITPEDKLTASFEVPYALGELKAVGSKGDKVEAQTAIRTVGQARAVRLTPDRTTIHAEAGDLSYVTVEVVDTEGCIDPNAQNNIFFTVQGVGEIAAVGSGNPTSTERYRGNQRQAFHGRCVVVVKSLGKPGKIQLRAQADGLDSAEVAIEAA